MVRELCEAYAGLVEPATVRQVVQGALRELRGSVSGASLPEMAARLAAVRLSGYVPVPLA